MMDQARKDAIELFRPKDCLRCHYEEEFCVYGKQSALLKRITGRMPSSPVWCKYDEYEQNVVVDSRYYIQNMVEGVLRKYYAKETQTHP